MEFTKKEKAPRTECNRVTVYKIKTKNHMYFYKLAMNNTKMKLTEQFHTQWYQKELDT